MSRAWLAFADPEWLASSSDAESGAQLRSDQLSLAVLLAILRAALGSAPA